MTIRGDASRTDIDGAHGWMTAAQVADALGVKRATVYAYVSRGILHRRMALDGRTSLFDRQQVEDLRRGGRGAKTGELRTVLATAITRVAGRSLVVRGHDLVRLVESGSGFEAVADLIWQADNTDSWRAAFADESETMFAATPAMPVLDRLRIAVATAAAADPLRDDLSEAVVRRTAPRLVRAMVHSMPVVDGSSVAASGPPTSRPPVTVARSLWPRLTAQAPDGPRLRALDVALALLADHGLATSTFAVRVAASVRAGPYAAVGAGLGALDGPFHGAASGGVHRSLATVAAGGDATADLADRGPSTSSIPGFGHTVYRSEDPRFGALLAAVERAWSGDPRRVVLDDYRRAIGTRTESAPNVDLALGYLTWMAEMNPEAGEAIFAVSRCAGWLGHAMEEYRERPLRLRPRGHYVGPLPLDEPGGR
ncbi:MAG: citrate synthase [Acidimicrobiia bacterium]|nr:citrate synthase [Acidimicrobiia bacterium]